MTTRVLQDRSRTGKDRPWGKHKAMNELLAAAYDDVRPDKAERLRTCATRLAFRPTDDGLKFAGTFFCRVRLCPMCSWRRSLKVAAQMNAIMDAIKADKPKSYILLTLTQRNCYPDELDESITGLLRAFNRLTELKDYKAAVLGYYRAVEVTHNLSEDTYHPHIHVVLCVNPSYFKSRNYVSQARWTELWRQCLRADYTPVVDVRKIKGDAAAAVAEVAKYAVKTKDYIIPDDWDMTSQTVWLLDRVLHRRRFVAFGGVFKDYHKKLNLDDAEDGDLVHVETDATPVKPDEHVIHFAWYSGYRQYLRDSD